MFCTNCGNRLHEGSVFCTNCGFKTEPVETPAPPTESVSSTDHSGDAEFMSVPAYAPVEIPASSHEPVFDVNRIKRVKKSPKPKAKLIISTILLLAIIITSVFSYITLFGFEGEWKSDGSTYKSEKAWMEKGSNILFDSGKLTVTDKSGKTETTGYSLKNNKIQFKLKDSDNTWDVDCGLFKMRLFNKSQNDSKKTDTIYFKRVITGKFWVYGGLIVTLIISFILSLLMGKKTSEYSSGTVSATYNLSVNPLSTTPSPNAATESTIGLKSNGEDIYYETQDEIHPDPEVAHTSGYVQEELPYNKEPVKYDYEQKHTSADTDSPESADSGTKLAPDFSCEKNVEIVFSPENSMAGFTAKSCSFVPGCGSGEALSSDDNASKPTEPPTAPVDSAILPSPVPPSAPVMPKPQKPSTDPSFKSAGDL